MAKIALLIGVSEYEPGLEPLPSAVNDVIAMQQVLTNPDMGEFADADVTVLQNPDRQKMEDAIYNLFANRAKEDLVLLYFSGHGVANEKGEFYFVSRFTRKDRQGLVLPPTAVAARSVRDWMEESESQRKVIILDSCFSSAFATGIRVKDSGSINPAQFLGGKGTAILTASTRYARAPENLDLSLYTHYLVEGLRTGAADRDNDGLIEIAELHEYVSSMVKEAAPAMTPAFYPVKEGYKIVLAKSPRNSLTKKTPETIHILEPQKAKLDMKKVNVFISFAQEDIKMLEQLEGHLTPLESINIWHQDKIIAGSDRINVIQNQLNIAKLILLLISSKFLNSADCQRDQAISLERYKKGKAIVIPILLKDMHLEGSSIENLEWLPKNRKPISSFSNKDKAFAEVVKGVSITIQSIQDEN